MSSLPVERPPLARRGGLARDQRSASLPPAAVPVAVGADVDAQLGALGRAWRLCRDVRPALRAPVVDYVLVGPGGIFVVAALRSPTARVWVRGDNLLVDGAWTPQLNDSRRSAQALATGLSSSYGRSIDVAAVVALVTDPERCAIQRQPHGAHVAAPGTLAAWLLAHPPRLDAGDVDVLHDHISDPGLWTRRAG